MSWMVWVLSHAVSQIMCIRPCCVMDGVGVESCCVTDHVYQALLCHGWCGC